MKVTCFLLPYSAGLHGPRLCVKQTKEQPTDQCYLIRIIKTAQMSRMLDIVT